MKVKIRKCIFETNSSSSHTLSLETKSDTYHYDNNKEYEIVQKYVDENNYIQTPTGEFGWNGAPLDSFGSKLAYCIAMIYETELKHCSWSDPERLNKILNDFPETEGYKTLDALLKEYCLGLKIKFSKDTDYPLGYIDHQSHENYKSLSDFLNYNNISLQRFLFDDSVYVLIRNDNEYYND